MSLAQERAIFVVICVPYWRVIVGSLKQMVQTLTISTSISFQEIFLVIQYITINKFLIHFTGLSWMRNWPIYLRILQSVKVMKPKALLAIIRFSLIVMLSFVGAYPTLYFYLKLVVTLWLIYNDIFYCFSMERLFKSNSFLCYSRPVYHVMFGIDVMLRTLWIMYPGVDGLVMIVLAKVIENYFRMEALFASQSSNLIEAILHMAIIDSISV